jgi:hypothetical protein
LVYITSQWNESTKQYHLPWKIRLDAQPWRVGEKGDILAIVRPVEGSWNDERASIKVPLCAMQSPTFVEATRQKEIQAILKFGRDSNWPLRITAAAVIAGKESGNCS